MRLYKNLASEGFSKGMPPRSKYFHILAVNGYKRLLICDEYAFNGFVLPRLPSEKYCNVGRVSSGDGPRSILIFHSIRLLPSQPYT